MGRWVGSWWSLMMEIGRGSLWLMSACCIPLTRSEVSKSAVHTRAHTHTHTHTHTNTIRQMQEHTHYIFVHIHRFRKRQIQQIVQSLLFPISVSPTHTHPHTPHN